MPGLSVPCPTPDCDGHIDVVITTNPGKRHTLTNTLDLHVGADQAQLADTITAHFKRYHRLGMMGILG